MIFEVIESENLVQNANIIGDRLKAGFIELKKEFKILGDVRGKGLVIGLEFVDSLDSYTPAPELTYEIILEGAKRGLMMGKLGTYGNVVRIAPPLTISKEEAEFTLRVFREILAKVSKG